MEQAKVNNGSLNAYEKVYCIQGLVIFVDSFTWVILAENDYDADVCMELP